jgi:hypothetical protein
VDWSPRATRRPSKRQAWLTAAAARELGSGDVAESSPARCSGVASLRFVVELNIQVRTPKSIRFNDLSRSSPLTSQPSRHVTSDSRQALSKSSLSHLVAFAFALFCGFQSIGSLPPIPLLSPSCSSSTSFCNPRFQTVSRDRLPGHISNLPLSHKSSTNITAMSRVTPPVTKFAHALRSISSSANAGRPSSLLDSQARASRYLPRNLKDLRAECKQRKLNSSGNKAEVRWDPLQCFHHSIDMI